MNRSKYKVGYWIRDNDLFATVELVFNQTYNLFKEERTWFEMWVNFKEEYFNPDLHSMNIDLPYYTKQGKYTWVTRIRKVEDVTPELHRLTDMGIDINLDNEDITKLIAKLV